MAKITKQITLDVLSPNMMKFVPSKQNDISSRFLNVTFTAGGEVVRIPADAEAIMCALRPDGQKRAIHGEILENGSVTLPLSGWLSEIEGCVRCDVSVYENEEKLTAMSFMIESEGTVMTEEELEDDEDYGAFSAMLSSLSTISASEEDRADAENLRNSAETSRAFAESSRVSAESSRVSAESSRVSAESARVSAESARATAETARASAESTRTTFIPSVSAEGVISWTNDKGLTNPTPVNIKGPMPVKGTDYWTDDDIEEIHDYIDNLITEGEW